VPLDFAESSQRILETALRVASPEGKVTLLHVVEWLPIVTESAFGIYPHRKDIDKLKQLSMEKLEHEAKAHSEHELKTRVKEGKPATAILDAVRQIQPDLIVMGTHGRSRLDHLLIGSVAERVMRKAPCDVLLVRF